jgi:SAM-dependent methyltransferase
MTLEINAEKLRGAYKDAKIDKDATLAWRAFKDTKIGKGQWKLKTARENLSRYISHERTPTLADLKDIARALGKEVCDICDGAPDEGIETIFSQQIFGLYENLEEGHVVSIVSPDGYLEAEDDDKEVFPQMVDTIRRKIDVRYYYPSGPQSKSLNDYARLLTKYEKELGCETVGKHVSGYAVPASHRHIFGWSTRYVVISKWNAERSQQEVEHVFLYTQTEALSEDKRIGKAVDVWVRLGENVARHYYIELCTVAEPLSNLGIYCNRLNSRVQEFYRTQFANFVDIYARIRTTVSSEKVLSSALNYVFSEWLRKWSVPDPDRPVFRVLDIGSGDGKTTAKAYQELKSKYVKGCAISLTTVESCLIPGDFYSKRLADPTTAKVACTFEDWLHEGPSFDIILAVHSMYLIDPIYLLRAYELLTDTGVVVVIASPRENNFLNLVCSAVDKLLPAIEPSIRKIRPYVGKQIAEDPFRNYAEDLHAMGKEFFGGVFHKLPPFEQELELSLFMDKDRRFTDFGRDLVGLFGNNVVTSKALPAIEKVVAKKISPDAEKGKVRNDTWALILSKKAVRESVGKTVNGEIV